MIEAEARAELFKLRTPLLSKGRLDTVLAETDLMQVRMRILSSSRESSMSDGPERFVVQGGRGRGAPALAVA